MEKEGRGGKPIPPTRAEQQATQIERQPQPAGGDVFVAHATDIQPKLPSSTTDPTEVTKQLARYPLILGILLASMTDEEFAAAIDFPRNMTDKKPTR